MDVKYKYLKELKDLFNKDFLYDESFIDFRDELKVLYPLVMEEISNSFIKLEPSQYTRYSEQEIKEINKLNWDSEDKVTCSVQLWFIKYGLKYLSIESILNLDNETGLYSDLCFNICSTTDHRMTDYLYNLQGDFLKFTKAYIADDIINYLNGKNELAKEGIKKSKDEESAWFQVGLLFASGEMDTLKKECNYKARAIARKKFPENPDKHRPWISESIGGASEGPKNILINHKKLKTIYDYCKKRGITMTDSFESLVISNTGS